MPNENRRPGEGTAACNDVLGNVDTSQSSTKTQVAEHYLAELIQRDQWVCWSYEHKFDGKATKVPIDPSTGRKADVTDASTWGKFGQAFATCRDGNYAGIGFVLTDDDPFGFIDLDDPWKKDAAGNLVHADPQAEYERQLKIVETFDSYTELSPSGRGVHIIVKTPGVDSGGKRGSVEVYTARRFMTMTANVQHAVPVAERGSLFHTLWKHVKGDRSQLFSADYDEPQSRSDADVHATATKAYGQKFTDLWEGRWQQHYPGASQSEADMGLFNYLAFVSRNREQCVRMFRASSLGVREKAKRDDYMAYCLDKAFGGFIKPLSFDHLLAEEWIKSQLEAKRQDDPSSPSSRFTLLNSTALRSLPRPDWRIKGVLLARGLAVIYGPSTAGKTFFALDMGCAIAEGRSWFGHRTKAAPVVYLALEGRGGIRLRAEAWEKHNDRELPIGIVLDSFNLKDPNDIVEIVKLCPPGTVLFIDTTARAGDDDENDNKQRREIIERASQLYELIDGCVVLIAHTGKDEEKGIRGHKSLFDSLDTSIVLSRTGDVRSWRTDKVKDGSDDKGRDFTLHSVELGEDDDGDPITSAVVKPNVVEPGKPFTKDMFGETRDAFAAFNIAAGKHGQLDANGGFAGLADKPWREQYFSARDGKPDAKRQAFNRAKKELLERGEIVEAGELYRLGGDFAAQSNVLIAQQLGRPDRDMSRTLV